MSKQRVAGFQAQLPRSLGSSVQLSAHAAVHADLRGVIICVAEQGALAPPAAFSVDSRLLVLGEQLAFQVRLQWSMGGSDLIWWALSMTAQGLVAKRTPACR